jgi:hypothetical protein
MSTIIQQLEKVKYGKWATTNIDKPCNPILYQPIENSDDINHLRNTMARGNYPLSMTDCEVVGINGDCGSKCPVLLSDNCPFEDELIDAYVGRRRSF